jgi:tetratricopeptide (TPR) repeat protein
MKLVRRSLLLVLLAAGAVLADTLTPARLVELERWKEARVLLEPRVRSHPNDAEAVHLLSRVRLAFGELDEALRFAEKAAALDPKNARYRAGVAQVVSVQASSAGMLRQIALARRARREAEAALALDPSSTEALSGLMAFHVESPAIVGGDRARALRLAEQIGRIDRVEGLMAQMRLVQGQRRGDQVLALHQQALELNPRHFVSLRALMDAALAGGKFEAAEKHARAALAAEPDRIDAYAGLAAVFAAQERWPELDAILADAERRIPVNYSAHLRAAGELLTTGTDLVRAERYGRLYLTVQAEPTGVSHAEAHRQLALILEALGRRDEAIGALETAIRLDPRLEAARRDLKRLRG